MRMTASERIHMQNSTAGDTNENLPTHQIKGTNQQGKRQQREMVLYQSRAVPSALLFREHHKEIMHYHHLVLHHTNSLN